MKKGICTLAVITSLLVSTSSAFAEEIKSETNVSPIEVGVTAVEIQPRIWEYRSIYVPNSAYDDSWGLSVGHNNIMGEMLKVTYYSSSGLVDVIRVKVLDQNGNLCGSVRTVSVGNAVSFPLFAWEGTWTIYVQSVNGYSGEVVLRLDSQL